MAKPIEFTPPKHDPREQLLLKLRNAPQEHVEALLDSYEILQLLRDKGLLEIAKGLLGSGEKVLGVLTQTMETEASIALIRNLTILVKLLGGLNPEVLESVESALAESVGRARADKTPGLFHLLTNLSGRDSRRFLDVVASVAMAVGKHLGDAETPGLLGEPREVITRRRVSMERIDPRG